MGSTSRTKKPAKIIRRNIKREVGIFIDGVALDRAARRVGRRIDLAALVKSLCGGFPATVARYYTLLPFEDDSRHRSYLDAVGRAGLQVCVKRLPPLGVDRLVSSDPDMAADMIAFTSGYTGFQNVRDGLMKEEGPIAPKALDISHVAEMPTEDSTKENAGNDGEESEFSTAPAVVKRIAIVVCPTRDISYPLGLAGKLGADTVSADFGEFAGKDVLKSAAKFIDLSGSETIWLPDERKVEGKSETKERKFEVKG